MKDTPEITAARFEADRARQRFLASLRAFEQPLLDLKQQLTPRHIMGEVWDGAKEKGADLAEDAVDAVKARPLATGGVVAALALFLAREPLMDLAGRLVDGFSTKQETKKRRKASSKTKAKTEAAE